MGTGSLPNVSPPARATAAPELLTLDQVPPWYIRDGDRMWW